MHSVPTDAICYTDANNVSHYFRRHNGSFVRSTVTSDGTIGQWIPINVQQLPVEVIEQLFDCVTDRIKLTAYHAYRTLCRWSDLNPSVQEQYATAATKSNVDKPLVELIRSMEERGVNLWVVHPHIIIPHCSVGGSFELTNPGCTISISDSGDLSIVTGPIANVSVGRGAHARTFTFNPTLRSFRYKIAEKTAR